MYKKLGIVVATAAVLLFSGCGPSYESVKPSVSKPVSQGIYDVDVNSNALFASTKLNTYEGDIGVVDIRMVKNKADYPVSAYINTAKVIIVRYKDFITEAKSGMLLFHSAITGKNVFDMRDAHFVYLKTPKQLAYYDIENFSNRKIKGIKYLKTRTAMKNVFILPNSNGKKLLTVTKDNRIALWSVNRKIRFNKILYKASSNIEHIEVSPSGKYLTYTDATHVHVLTLDRAKEVATFALREVTDLDYSPQERKIAIATKNGTVTEFSLETKKEIRHFSIGFDEYANGISYADNEENILVTASNRGFLKTWVLISNKYILKTKNSLVTYSPNIRDYCSERNKFFDAWYEDRKESAFYKKYTPVETKCSLFGSREQVIEFANKGILNDYIETYVGLMHLPPDKMKQYKTDLKTNLQVRRWFLALNGGQYYGVEKIFGKIFAYGTGHRGNNFKFRAVVIDKTKPSLFAQATLLNSYAGVMINYTYDIGKQDSFAYEYYNAIDQYNFLAISKFTSDKEYHGTYLRVNSDKHNIVFASKANRVEIWDTTSQPKLQNIILDNGEISALAYNKEKNLLAIGSSSKTIKIWNLNSMKMVATLSGHTYKIRSLVFFDNGKKLISSGYYDKSVRIWDMQTMKNIKQMTYECRSVQEIHIAPDQKSFAVDIRTESGMSNPIEHSFINVYDSKTYTLIKTLKPQIGYIREFKYSDDGKTIYAVSAGISFEKQRLHRFAKIDLATNKTKVYKFNPNFRFVTDFVVMPKEKVVIVSGTGKYLYALDLETLQEIKTVDMGEKASYNTIPSLSKTDDNKIVAGSKINNVNMFSFH